MLLLYRRLFGFIVVVFVFIIYCLIFKNLYFFYYFVKFVFIRVIYDFYVVKFKGRYLGLGYGINIIFYFIFCNIIFVMI